MNSAPHTYTAFIGQQQIAAGSLEAVARQGKSHASEQAGTMLVFDDASGEQLEIDLHGSLADIRQRLLDSTTPTSAAPAPRTAGRPRLGVIAREVTLLPRHWQWLTSQPGGASVALRKLVEQASRNNASATHRRQAQEACYRFMAAMAGNLPDFEEATRALFANQSQQFQQHTHAWPKDIREHARNMAVPAFTTGDS